MRRSWTRPPWVSLRKRMTRSALTNRTFLTVWSFSCRYNMPSVPQGLGDERYAVRSRHGQKGGGRCGGWDRGNWGRGLRQRVDDSGRVGLRDTEPLSQGRQGASGGITEDAQRCQQDW